MRSTLRAVPANWTCPLLARWLTLTAWGRLSLLPSGDVESLVLTVFPQGKIPFLPLGVLPLVAWLVWQPGRESATIESRSVSDPRTRENHGA